MRSGYRCCPVCWQSITSTTGGYVQQHWDSIGRDVCPMAGEQYALALDRRPRRTRHLAVAA